VAEIQKDFFDELKVASNGNANKIKEADQAFHSWYRFVLSFPPHLVRKYMREFGLAGGARVLDPFSGTGTTLVEAKLNKVASIGVEANPFAHFAGDIKTTWEIDPDDMWATAREIAKSTKTMLAQDGIVDEKQIEIEELQQAKLEKLAAKKTKLLIKDSISPIPLHKTLILRSRIDRFDEKLFYRHLLLALANSTVLSASNLRFGPEVGVGKIKKDAPVISSWLAEVKKMSIDIAHVLGGRYPDAVALLGDARMIDSDVEESSIDAVITSPPYPNEKDYSRTTRLESVILNLIETPKELRAWKKTFIRSNTRGVYKDDDDGAWVKDFKEITTLAQRIEEKRIHLGKTSGFEKRYAKVTLEYFGGMARHLQSLRKVLRPGARLAYVVGDQASYLRIMIRTGKLLAQIAESLGYRVEGRDLFRTRFATATQEELNEEVLHLRWP
jgi:DNA modification methylase